MIAARSLRTSPILLVKRNREILHEFEARKNSARGVTEGRRADIAATNEGGSVGSDAVECGVGTESIPQHHKGEVSL